MASPSHGPGNHSAAMRPGTIPQQQHRQRNDGQSLPPSRAPHSSGRAEEAVDGLPAPESWIEVSSHPSSSSVSSIGEEIVTTGLQVGNSYLPRRRRPQPRSHAQQPAQQQQQHPSSASSAQAVLVGATSSQEEYEESDSEDDRVLTSSTENITLSQAAGGTPVRQVFPATSRRHPESDSSDEDDDDENATALGRRPSEPFRPQPNAFSHPPSHLSHRHSASSAIPSHHPRPSFGQRASTRLDRRASNFMTPADNDAALRASLTTLLSCAAAARGRPKDDSIGEQQQQQQQQQEKAETALRSAGPAASNQPIGLRMMSENELNTAAPGPAAAAPHPASLPRQKTSQSSSPPSPRPRRAAPPPTSTSAGGSGEKIKRSATPGTSGGGSSSSKPPPRATKKKKTTAAAPAVGDETTFISPTLLTWVVSAGVVVLISVVGFGAGYVIGREVGRQEALSGGLGAAAGNASTFVDGGSCGAELVRGGGGGGGGTLRRFRWGGGVSSVAA